MPGGGEPWPETVISSWYSENVNYMKGGGKGYERSHGGKGGRKYKRGKAGMLRMQEDGVARQEDQEDREQEIVKALKDCAMHL